MIHLRQLGPALIRHGEAYGQLALAASRDLGLTARRRAVLAIVGLTLGMAWVVLAGGSVIAAGWDSVYRYWVIGGVLGALGVATFACLAAATASIPESTHLLALKAEWQKDRAWLASRDSARRDPAMRLAATADDAARSAAVSLAAVDRNPLRRTATIHGG